MGDVHFYSPHNNEIVEPVCQGDSPFLAQSVSPLSFEPPSASADIQSIKIHKKSHKVYSRREVDTIRLNHPPETSDYFPSIFQ